MPKVLLICLYKNTGKGKEIKKKKEKLKRKISLSTGKLLLSSSQKALQYVYIHMCSSTFIIASMFCPLFHYLYVVLIPKGINVYHISKHTHILHAPYFFPLLRYTNIKYLR